MKLSIGLMQRYDDRPHVNCCVKNKNAATLLLSYMSDHDKITSHSLENVKIVKYFTIF